MTEYKIVYADKFSKLETEVNEKLNEGWRLYKQPFSRVSNRTNWICQIMIKNETS